MSARTVITALCIFLSANAISCSIVRLAFGGTFTIEPLNYSAAKQNFPRLYLISGLKSQPANAYRYFNFSRYRLVYCRFSYLGYNPFRAGRQLTRLVKPGDTVCGLSVGAKAIECSALPPDQPIVLINPCSCPDLLNRQRRIYPYIKYVAPLAEVATFLMGWVAVLPLLPGSLGDNLSLALFVDQLFWIGAGQPRRPLTKRTGVVISQQDEWLPLERQRRHYHSATCVEIAASHGRIANLRYAPQYVCALDDLLQRTSGA